MASSVKALRIGLGQLNIESEPMEVDPHASDADMLGADMSDADMSDDDMLDVYTFQSQKNKSNISGHEEKRQDTSTKMDIEQAKNKKERQVLGPISRMEQGCATLTGKHVATKKQYGGKENSGPNGNSAEKKYAVYSKKGQGQTMFVPNYTRKEEVDINLPVSKRLCNMGRN